MPHTASWTLLGLSASAAALAARRRTADAHVLRAEGELLSEPTRGRFSPKALAGLPEPARRYLSHALASGTSLAGVARLDLAGTMTTAPGSPAVSLRASEVLAPRRGFIWSARARLRGLPVRVRDTYLDGQGAGAVDLLGVLPGPRSRSADVTRSARGRLVAEAVWCPSALVHPEVTWHADGPDRARYTLPVDGEAVSVTLSLAPDGALREVTLDRWGDIEGRPWRLVPYGFRVDAEGTVGGVTIPTRVVGGWRYGTDAFDPAGAARFTVCRAAFGPRAPLAAPVAPHAVAPDAASHLATP